MPENATFICIPTTSGTGSEVTPFAVITDSETNVKYPLADFALTPDVAIIDPQFVMSVPKSVTADTGMDVLTHAMESYVSVMASDYTRGLSLQAIKLTFEYLKSSVEKGDKVSREKMHNASTLAGMAFANAFLGLHTQLHIKLVANMVFRMVERMRYYYRILSVIMPKTRKNMHYSLNMSSSEQIQIMQILPNS